MKNHPGMQEAITTQNVLNEVATERKAQRAKWGQQDHSDGVTPWKPLAAMWEAIARQYLAEGPSWAPILMEEVGEALTAEDEAELRAELVQIAAVAVAWVEAIDRRKGE